MPGSKYCQLRDSSVEGSHACATEIEGWLLAVCCLEVKIT